MFSPHNCLEGFFCLGASWPGDRSNLTPVGVSPSQRFRPDSARDFPDFFFLFHLSWLLFDSEVGFRWNLTAVLPIAMIPQSPCTYRRAIILPCGAAPHRLSLVGWLVRWFSTSPSHFFGVRQCANGAYLRCTYHSKPVLTTTPQFLPARIPHHRWTYYYIIPV